MVAPTKSTMGQELLETIMNASSEARISGPSRSLPPPRVLQLYKEYTKS